MNEQERIDLFRRVFPFWDRMSDTDKDTFLRSSSRNMPRLPPKIFADTCILH